MGRGGFSKEFCIVWLAKVKPGGHQPGDSVCDIDFSRHMHWATQGEAGNKVYSTWVAGSSVVVDEKKVLERNLASNLEWCGALARMNDLKLDTLNDIFPAAGKVFTNDPGASAWLTLARVHAFRCGPSAFPLPGSAALWFNNSPLTEVVLTMLPLEDMLGKGICASGVSQFRSTPSGISFFEQSGVPITLKGGEAAFSLVGMLVISTAVVDLQGRLSDERREQLSLDNAAIVHLPLFMTTAPDSAPEGVLRSVARRNDAHLKRRPDSKLWSTRHERVQQWMVDTGIASTTLSSGRLVGNNRYDGCQRHPGAFATHAAQRVYLLPRAGERRQLHMVFRRHMRPSMHDDWHRPPSCSCVCVYMCMCMVYVYVYVCMCPCSYYYCYLGAVFRVPCYLCPCMCACCRVLSGMRMLHVCMCVSVFPVSVCLCVCVQLALRVLPSSCMARMVCHAFVRMCACAQVRFCAHVLVAFLFVCLCARRSSVVGVARLA